MKALFLTNEYPPHIYGGAGIHVQYLTRELSRLCDVEVRCFGDQNDNLNPRLHARGFGLDSSKWTCPKPLASVFGALQRGLDFNTSDIDANLVHLHTWYSHFGGIVAKLNYGIPMVLTTHSLEPLRPWKREQLAGATTSASGWKRPPSRWQTPSSPSPRRPRWTCCVSLTPTPKKSTSSTTASIRKSIKRCTPPTPCANTGSIPTSPSSSS
ncbi:glycosyltransferase [Verrucomicrobium spinosum]|uniref:glycosyltransferase n=1 Tax=Verrucomicrobium spinosum TaxID=2736 RepID=UPI000AA9A5CF|nr:glycosyltransferase [Verrucomicrobium spinosum]